MKLKVNASNYAKFQYDPFIDKSGYAIPRPAKVRYNVGDVVYIKPENAIGVVLGVISEQGRELRTDMSGMVAYSDLKPATRKDFTRKGVRFVPRLKEELFDI